MVWQKQHLTKRTQLRYSDSDLSLDIFKNDSSGGVGGGGRAPCYLKRFVTNEDRSMVNIQVGNVEYALPNRKRCQKKGLK